MPASSCCKLVLAVSDAERRPVRSRRSDVFGASCNPGHQNTNDIYVYIYKSICICKLVRLYVERDREYRDEAKQQCSQHVEFTNETF